VVRRLWAIRGVWLGLLAAGTAAAGETFLFQPEQRATGSALLVGAAGLAALAWSGLREAPLLERRAAPGPHRPRTSRVWGRLVGIGGALLLTWGSLLAWWADPRAIFGLQGGLWLLSMALLVAACARWYPADQRERDLGPPWTRQEAVLFGGILALSLFTHVAYLTEIPWRFHFDEIFAFQESLRFYRGPMISLFTTTWVDTGLPSLWFPATAGLMRIVGPGLDGVRAGVALCGALTVIPVYGLARLMAGRTAAAIAAFLVAVSMVYVHYSRISIINDTTAFMWAVCFYFLWRGFRSRRPGDFAWAGLSAGLSMYTFYGTRLLPYLLLVYIGYLAVFHFRAFRERLAHFALIPVGFVIGFGPLIAYFVQHPQMWWSRALDKLNVPLAIPTTWDGWVSDWNVLAPLMQLNFLSLSVEPSRDGFWFAPFLLPVEAGLLCLGIGVLVWRWRQPAAFLTLLWGGSVVFAGGTLIEASRIPGCVHWVPAFPAFYLALALPLALWLRALRRLDRRAWGAAAALIALGLAADGVANATAYLVTYPRQVRADQSLEAAQGRFLTAQSAHTRVRFVGNSWQSFNPTVAALLAPQVPASDFLNPSRELPLVGDPDHDLMFVFYNDHAFYLPLVADYYPGGVHGQIQTPDGTAVADTYQIAAAQAMSRHGARLTVTGMGTGGAVWQGSVAQVGMLPQDAPLIYPLTATWSAAFFAGAGGPLRLSLENPATVPVGIWVAGAVVRFDTPLTVEAGWVPLVVQARFAQPGSLRVLAQTTGAPTELDTAHLWPQAPNAGLTVTLSGSPPAHRIDPFLGATLLGATHEPDADGIDSFLVQRDPDLIPLAASRAVGRQMRWAGELYATAGTYKMELFSDAHALLWVDGQVAVNLCRNAPQPGGRPGGSGTVALTTGWHAVRVDFEATGVDNGLEWVWTRPDGVREVIPPWRLRYQADAPPGAPVAWPPTPVPVACPP
jgi:4-amino-4-deoxy-L-arabinose transferase-like glycosyltransferase